MNDAVHEFTDRYMITSRTGRVYTRKMVIDAAMRSFDVRDLALARAEIAAVVDDHDWMRARRGYTPGALAKALADEAWVRRPLRSAPPAETGAP